MTRPWLMLVAAILLGGCGHGYGSRGDSADSGAPTAPVAGTKGATTAASKVHKLANGLQYEDLVVGNGKMADPGLTAVINYTGWLTNGFKFDSSFDRGKPLPFTIGAAQMIRGFDEGVKGMRVGGKRRLTIPPDLGFGAMGAGNGLIPPNSTLIFEVELLEVK